MTFNKRFLKFALVASLLFWGSFQPSHYFFLLGLSLIGFWTIQPWIKRWASPQHRLPYTVFGGMLCHLLPLAWINEFVLALMAFISLLWAGYALTNRQTRGSHRLWGQRPQALPDLTQLKATIRDLDKEVHQLKLLKTDQFQAQAQQTLQKLAQLEQDLQLRARQLDRTTYQRLIKRIASEHQAIQDRLRGLDRDPNDPYLTLKINELAPELVDLVRTVQLDVVTIERRIKTSTAGNQAELLTLHKTNHQRFQAILTGYLNIKASPSHYYDADQRLETAQAAMTRFAQTLKEQIRQLNEEDMHEFEVNLRLLNNA